MRSRKWPIVTLTAAAVAAGVLWLTGCAVSPVDVPSVDAPNGPTAPLQGWTMIWTLLGIFAGGMALNLTPCIYPLIPITVSYFGGRATGADTGPGSLVAHGLCYVAGLAVTNSLLGVVAALTGGLMGGLLQNPLVLSAVAVVLVVFATSLFGFWELRLPAGLTQAAAKPYPGYFGSVFMGLTLGIVTAPCIGPFVLGLITWVAGIGSPLFGFLVFFTLSLGLGCPLFVLAVFSGYLDRLPRSGGWMVWVRKLMGWVLIGMAAHLVSPVLPVFAETWLLAAVAVAAGVHLGWVDRTMDDSQAFLRTKAATGLICFALAAFLAASGTMRGAGVEWKPYSEENLQEAQRLKRPVVIDFYAAWCMPCRELERFTFSDSSVVERARNGFAMLKVDLTAGGDPLHRRLMQQYGIRGVPTVVFLDAAGRERKDLRVVGYIPPERFLGLMDALAKAGS